MGEAIAIISSTIVPPSIEHYGGNHARWTPEERLEQTRGSIRSLVELGIDDIYLADNSGGSWRDGMDRELRPARVRVFSHHQYRNKGISELYLLLAALPGIP